MDFWGESNYDYKISLFIIEPKFQYFCGAMLYLSMALFLIILWIKSFKKMKKVSKIKKFFQNFEKTLARNKTLAITKIKNINIIWEKISSVVLQ
mgnify:CR=1 FL=1